MSLKSIIIIGILLRVMLFIFFSPWNDMVRDNSLIISDARQYNNVAINLMEGVYSCDDPNSDKIYVDNYRVPLFPVILRQIYECIGYYPVIYLLLQIVMQCFAIAIIYYTALLIGCSLGGATFGAMIMAFHPDLIVSSMQFLPDTLFMLCLCGFLYYFYNFIIKDNEWSLVLAGICLGLSVLAKPISIFLPILAVAMIIIHFVVKYGYKNISIIADKLFSAFTFFVLAFLIVIQGWVLSNYEEFGRFGISSQTGPSAINFMASKILSNQQNIPNEISRGKMMSMLKEKYELSPDFEIELKNKGMYTPTYPIYTLDKYRMSEEYWNRETNTINNISEYSKAQSIVSFYFIKNNLSRYAEMSAIGYVQTLAVPQFQEAFRMVFPTTDFDVFIKSRSFDRAREIGYNVFVYSIFICIIMISINGIVMITAGYGTFMAKNKMIAIFNVLIIVYFLVLIGPAGNSRYKVLILPPIALLASNVIRKKNKTLVAYSTTDCDMYNIQI